MLTRLIIIALLLVISLQINDIRHALTFTEARLTNLETAKP